MKNTSILLIVIGSMIFGAFISSLAVFIDSNKKAPYFSVQRDGLYIEVDSTWMIESNDTTYIIHPII